MTRITTIYVRDTSAGDNLMEDKERYDINTVVSGE